MNLSEKKIIVGVSGGIAAYKTAHLVRLLKKAGAEVQVIMTESATTFITPLTLATLSENPVLIHFQKQEAGEWNNHVQLGLWADALLIAPAGANTLAKMAHGIADNLLIATYLSARCPVFFAPAMDLDMYQHPAVIENIKLLRSFGNILIDAEFGELASGLYGKGRMAEPEHIVAHLENFFSSVLPLKGKKVMITIGATCEYLDPVRYLTNASSGKMGFALAECACNSGAEVTAIVGNVTTQTNNPKIKQIQVKTALEMWRESENIFPDMDYVIFCAAVADYRPKQVATHKIKKNDETLIIEFVKNPDIAFELGKKKQKHQFTIGFALETQDALANGRQKLINKNFDMLVLNSLENPDTGFGYDTNQVTILTANQEIAFPLKTKKEVAQDIWENALKLSIDKSKT